MEIKWLLEIVLIAVCLQAVTNAAKCPEQCICSLDKKGRLETICRKGGMRAVPVTSLDPDVRVIEIHGPRNSLTIGPIFLPFAKLEVLRITDSNVPAIGKNSFWGVQTLRVLDLSCNNITQITNENFRGQDGLHELDLSTNKIDRMPSATFYHLKDLRWLNLADNSIEELLQRVFHLLDKLKYLDLSGNPLRNLLPDVFKDVRQLRVLKCRHCQLHKINPQLYNYLQELRELDLGDNQLKYLERGEFRDIKKLEVLHLDGNQLSVVIDSLFESQRSLEFLDISRNRLAKVTDDAFDNLQNLTYLDLSYNKLVRLEAASVAPLRRLQSLNISGNLQMNFIEIKDTFTLVHNLTALSVADIGPDLPLGLLVPFRQLKSLNLSGNHMDNTSLVMLNPVSNLEFLDLSRNQLNGVSDAVAEKLRRIREVRLENNPLICDRCHLGTLIEIVESLTWDTLPACFLPNSLRGASIADLSTEGLDWCIEYIEDEGYDAASTSYNFLERGNINALAFVGGTIFVLMAILVLIAAVCMSKHRARYYTHEDKRIDASASEKHHEPPVITNNEISFKFPIEDRVCTIDDMVLPPPPPPPPVKSMPPLQLPPTIPE